MLSATPSGQVQRPDQESNLDQDLRRVLCAPLHHRDKFTPRADDWIRTSINRIKRPVHYLVCHSPESVGAEGVEPSAWSL